MTSSWLPTVRSLGNRWVGTNLQGAKAFLRTTLVYSLSRMPEFCDVALAVPLDMVFSYRVPDGATPVVGGRVLVPFRQQRMTGIVVEAHDRKPSVQTKSILSVLDTTPALDEQLLRL